jgi:hypothetical protein
MPNVPFLPGVPILSSFSAPPTPALLLADAVSVVLSILGPQWGIFDATGLPVVIADNVVAVDFRQEWIIAEYPLEQGAFESYDKVLRPFEVRVRFSTGGSVLDRQEFLNSIAAIAGTTDLFTVVTPEVTLPSVNITRYAYHRAADEGVGLVKVDVFCQQVNISTSSLFASTAQPQGADPQSDGTVTATVPTAQQNMLAGLPPVGTGPTPASSVGAFQ